MLLLLPLFILHVGLFDHFSLVKRNGHQVHGVDYFAFVGLGHIKWHVSWMMGLNVQYGTKHLGHVFDGLIHAFPEDHVCVQDDVVLVEDVQAVDHLNILAPRRIQDAEYCLIKNCC